MNNTAASCQADELEKEGIEHLLITPPIVHTLLLASQGNFHKSLAHQIISQKKKQEHFHPSLTLKTHTVQLRGYQKTAHIADVSSEQ